MNIKNGQLSEDQLQARIWKRAWRDYSPTRRLLWHVPNQGASGKEGARLKAMGVLEGVWDIHLFWKGTLHIFELKVPGRQLTRDRVDRKGRKHFGQKEWGDLMALHGAVQHVCYTEEQFFLEFEAIVGPPQALAGIENSD